MYAVPTSFALPRRIGQYRACYCKLQKLNGTNLSNYSGDTRPQKRASLSNIGKETTRLIFRVLMKENISLRVNVPFCKQFLDVQIRTTDRIGRLRHVDIIIGANGCFTAQFATSELDRAVGDPLVHVHVRLGAGARLPDRERKLTVQFADDHIVGHLDDPIGFLPGQMARLGVHHGRGLFHIPIGMVDRFGHMVIANGEVDQGALRLRPQ
jgi:hypothetical protein